MDDSVTGLGSRMDLLDERVERIERQIGTLVTSVQKFTEALTDLVRVDERVAQLLLTNQHLGAKVEQQNTLVTQIQLDIAALKSDLRALQDGGRDQRYWMGRAIWGVIALLTAVILAKYGIHTI